MKNRLLALLLVVALVVTVSVFAVGAETPETNPFEGQTGYVTAVCEHCGGEEVDWAPIPANRTGEIQGWTDAKAGYTHFYLSADNTCGSSTTIAAGEEYCINLNGFTDTRASGTVFYTINGGTLNIMDSSLEQTGAMDIPYDGASIIKMTAEGGTVNQYGGTFKHSFTDSTIDVNGTCAHISGGTYNMYGGTFTGTSAWAGGGVYLVGGTFNLAGGTVTTSTASTAGGGGFYVQNATLNMTAGTITGCSSPLGGAICAVEGAEINLTGGKIYQNTTSGGGHNIYTSGADGNKAILNIGGTFQLGHDTQVQSVAASGVGVYANSQTTITISGGTIQNLTTTGRGGALTTNSGSVSITMTGGLIQNCTAADGGAIALNVATPVNFSGGEIKNCSATTAGGAIGVVGTLAPTITISGDAKITNCSAPEGGAVALTSSAAGQKIVMTGGTIDGCTGTIASGNQKGGGAILVKKGTFDFSGGTIQNCSATNAGGGAINNLGGTVNLKGGTIDTCSAPKGPGGAYHGSSAGAKLNFSAGEIKNCSAVDGGALYFQWQSKTNEMTGTAKITNCSATATGGAIRIQGSEGPGITISGGTLSGCYAKGNGGYICLASSENGFVTMTGGRIEGDRTNYNTGAYGGAVYVNANNTFTLDGGTIYQTYCDGQGGAIFAKGSTSGTANVVIKSGTIDGTRSDDNHGGIAMNNYTTFTMSGGTIKNTLNQWTGGALSISASEGTATGTITGGTIDSCAISTASPGAGLYLSKNANVTVENLTIKNCSTKGSGANLCIDATTANEPVFTNCSFIGGNTQQAADNYGYGANIFVAAPATFDSCTIIDGRGKEGGANIYVNGTAADVTITGDSLIRGGQAEAKNPPASRGGNITVYKGTLTLTGNTVVDGAGGTTAFYMGKNINVYGAGATLNLAGNTVVKGCHNADRTDSVAIDPGCFVTVADTVNVNGIYLRKTEADGTMTVKEGFAGEVFVALETADLKAAVVPGADIGAWLAQEAGYTNTGAIKVMDTSQSGKLLADIGDAFKVALFGGFKDSGNVDENGEKIYAEEGLADLNTSSDYAYIKAYADGSFTLTADTVLDLNNGSLTINTNGYKLTPVEYRTDTGSVPNNYLTNLKVDDPANLNTYGVNPTNGYQYIVLGDNTTGYTAHRIRVSLDKVSIKTTECGIYYTTTIQTNANLAKYVVSYGTAVSLVEEPTADFVNQPSVLFTEYSVDNQNDKMNLTTRSALVANILKEDEADNGARSAMPIYATSFVIINTGSGAEDIYVMADETFDLSLNDVMERLDAKYEDLTDAQKTVADNFYAKWLAEGGFAGATLPNFEAAQA